MQLFVNFYKNNVFKNNKSKKYVFNTKYSPESDSSAYEFSGPTTF